MIVQGSARPTLQRGISRSLQPAFEQLNLPWLCPAMDKASSVRRPDPQRRSTATMVERRPSPRRTSSSPGGKLVSLAKQQQHGRNYAFVTPSGEVRERQDYLPWAGSSQSAIQAPGVKPEDFLPWAKDSSATKAIPPQSWGQPPEPTLYNPPQFWDVSKTFVVTDSTTLPPQSMQSPTTGMSTSNIAEVHANLEACLAVGLHKRAVDTMHRLNKIYKPDAPDLLRAHNFYLGHLLGQFYNNGEAVIDKYAQNWYHGGLLNVGIKPNATTFSLMLQFALRDTNRSRASRRVRRYIDEADGQGVELHSIISELSSSVTSEELRAIANLAPERFGDIIPAQEGYAALGAAPADGAGLSYNGYATAQDTTVTVQAPAELNPMSIKSGSLALLKQSLSGFKDLNTEIDAVREDKLSELVARQRRLEEDGSTAALQSWRTQADSAVGQQMQTSRSIARASRQLGTWLWNWHQALLPLVQEEMAKFEASEELSLEEQSERRTTEERREDHDRAVYGPYMRFLSPDQMSVATITAMINTSVIHGTTDLKLTRLISAIGSALETEASHIWSERRAGNKYLKPKHTTLGQQRKYGESAAQGTQDSHLTASRPHTIASNNELSPDSAAPPMWSKQVQMKLGAVLASMFFKAAKVPNMNANSSDAGSETKSVSTQETAFTTDVKFSKGRRSAVVNMHEWVKERLEREPLAELVTKQLPMLAPPRPWRALDSGAYLKDGQKLVRLPSPQKQAKTYLNLAMENGDMEGVTKGIDHLSSTAWKINRDVLEVMSEVWNSGEAFANMPPSDPKIDLPPMPAADASKLDRYNYYIAKKMVLDEAMGLHSERCFQNFQLEVARSYAEDEFYLPHNLDFRGRAYPIPPYLNQMGADHCRGLLVFAKGKALGERGLRWLKIHLANVYGYDKASLDDRAKFADEHMGKIHETADQPLAGSRWWLNGDDPWQILATCKEIVKAVRSSDPAKYVCHLPVHQDGSCNGLQHYAALGGDEFGAKQVNLEPGDRPSDIYTAVASLVREGITADAENGMDIAKLLQDKIVRKVVKQPVMTNVYGVTFEGARKQVDRQLADLYPKIFGNEAGREGRLLSLACGSYIAREIFNALGKIFNGATNIQKWLVECGSKICDSLTPEQIQMVEDYYSGKPIPSQFKSGSKATVDKFVEFRSSIIWTTPLGMPVVQPYRVPPKRTVSTSLATLNIHDPDSAHHVAKRKQLQAFPPNFIHSLDATHMLLTATRCKELGMEFASVHDSFWTHPSDIDNMGNVIRETFIQMHGEDVVKRLASEFQARYSKHLYLAKVDKKSEIGKKLKKARLTLRMKRLKDPVGKNMPQESFELLLERRRQDLLNSGDPAKIAEAATIESPSSIYQEWQASQQEFQPENIAAMMPRDAPEDVSGCIELGTELLGSKTGSLSEHEEDWAEVIDEPVTTSRTEEIIAGAEADAGAAVEITEGSVENACNAPETKFTAAKRKKTPTLWMSVWMPMQFPPVPEKGTWDINRIRDSTYFFS